MYKLILVDDEEDVREGVSQEIDWHEHGFEVLAKAENGKEALDLVERLRPDVVVTDIKMPFMDGLQLAEAVRRQFPATRIIILTGFDEFEYAQKAVKLHIDEYVLKPFSAIELIDALLKVKNRMDEEAAHRENNQLLRESYRKSLPVLREVFLSSLLTRQLTREDIFAKASEYSVQLQGSEFLVSVLCLDQKKKDEEQILLFAVKNIAQEQVKLGAYACLVFLHNDLVVLLLRRETETEHQLEHQMQMLAEEIRRTVEKYLSVTVTVGIGTVIRDVTQLSYSYQDAAVALDYKGILGNNRLIFIDDVEKQPRESVRFDERKEHDLVRCIKMGTLPELHTVVDELFCEVEEGNISIQDYRIYLLEMITTILKTAQRAELDMDQLFGGHSHLLAEIATFNNVQEAKNRVIDICEKIMSSIASGRHHTYKRLVDQAIAYTHRHFQSPDISIHKVCADLHISPGYFSSIFKRETKTTFVTYLLQLRMEKAKELLRTTDLKTFEIAEQVGYSDANYFSFCFRKHVGLSAKEYRNSSGKEE
ncbi:DNA-binding response regulator [Brevibacillus nitrificans]|uniref:DNA-binding response regulator n=1 Tax=Brevibacillus nitrificans TaxID=651560 RepID=A0A3M8D5B0_9BACL|nr:response regulator [Brevibacillus nitrificans]RNB83274.1 DNA-binding response regulator [Brevibacillus nitrificans]